MLNIPSVSPFTRHGSLVTEYWSGKLYSLDNTSTNEFIGNDIKEVLFSGEIGDWNGEVACICQLKDGRDITWETNWGPTGHGFAEDAYGGDADILVSSTLYTAIMLGLTPDGRALCGAPTLKQAHDGD